jgi:hypothetical protein
LKRSLALVAIATALCRAADAHHSYAGYDACATFTVEGEIERISWANPHVVFALKVDDEQSYLVQWASVQRLSKEGVEVDALKVGDRVVVIGSANRDPDVHIVTLVTSVRRPRDGWEWVQPIPATRSCDGRAQPATSSPKS